MKYVIEMEFDFDDWSDEAKDDYLADLTYDIRSSRFLVKWGIVEKAKG